VSRETGERMKLTAFFFTGMNGKRFFLGLFSPETSEVGPKLEEAF